MAYPQIGIFSLGDNAQAHFELDLRSPAQAAQRLIEANALPVNLRFACDGEEEIGGTTIVDYLRCADLDAQESLILY